MKGLAYCIIFSLAGITDALDGYLARKLNQTSSLGAFLHPVADKLMVAVALVLLVQQAPNLLLALKTCHNFKNSTTTLII